MNILVQKFWDPHENIFGVYFGAEIFGSARKYIRRIFWCKTFALCTKIYFVNILVQKFWAPHENIFGKYLHHKNIIGEYFGANILGLARKSIMLLVLG